MDLGVSPPQKKKTSCEAEEGGGLGWRGAGVRAQWWKSQPQQQECRECGSRSRPAGINGGSPAPRVAPSSPGKGESCRPPPATRLLLLLRPKGSTPSPAVPLTGATGEPGEDGRAPSGDLLCARSLATLPWLLSWLSWVLLASCLFTDSNRSGPKAIKNPIKI